MEKDPKIITANNGDPLYNELFFDILPGKAKYSDWDIHCKVINQDIDVNTLKIMMRFIKEDSSFSDVGIFLSKRDEHASLNCYINHLGVDMLQFLGFMNDEPESPFVDIHIEGIAGEQRRQLVNDISDEEFMCWAYISYWRKNLKGSAEDKNAAEEIFLNRIINPINPDFKDLSWEDQKQYMEEFLETKHYDSEVDFLKGV